MQQLQQTTTITKSTTTTTTKTKNNNKQGKETGSLDASNNVTISRRFSRSLFNSNEETFKRHNNS